jgi:hypothetical protein
MTHLPQAVRLWAMSAGGVGGDGLVVFAVVWIATGDLGGPVGSRRSNDVGVRWRVTPAGGVWPGDFCEGLNLLAEPRQEVSGLSMRDSGLRLEPRAGARRAVVMARSAGMDVIGGRC